MATAKAKVKIKDESGKEIKGAALNVKSEVSAPKTDIKPEFEKPLVSVSISNPFKKILYWLDQIRKHQTTTFAFKLSIPLIALPVIIFAAYQIGRGEGLTSLFEWTSQASPSPIAFVSPSPVQNVEISKAGILKIAKGTSRTRYLLSLRNGTIVTLDIPETIDLSKYANKQVLVTGFQDKTTRIIHVTDIAEIEVFNVTEIPKETPSPTPVINSPTPIPTPEATDSAN